MSVIHLDGNIVISGGFVDDDEWLWCATVTSDDGEICAAGSRLDGTMEVLGGKLLESFNQRGRQQ